MYEQFIRYWFIWMIVIIVAFFMKNGWRRSLLLVWILLILLLFEVDLNIGNIQISLAFIILFIGSIIFYVHHSFSIYTLIVTFIMMIAFGSILMWAKTTPVWLFMPSYVLIPIIVVMLVIILINSFYLQLTVTLVGITLGQMMFEMILMVYHLSALVGEETFFIHISLAVLLLIVLRFLNFILNCLLYYIKTKVNLTKKLL